MGLFDAISGIFGGDDGGTKVDAIDPNELIQTQARVNRVDQITPFGNLTFSGQDRNKLNFKLPPKMQALLNAQSGFGQEATQRGRQMLNQIPQNGDEAVNAQLARLQPGFDQQNMRLRERLEQSGNPAAFGGDFSEGAFNDLSLLGQTQNDARLAAVLQGPQYQGQLINNATALGNSSPIGVPQFNFQGASPVDVNGAFSLAQNGQQFNAQQQQKSNSGALGGLFDLGVAGLGLF